MAGKGVFRRAANVEGRGLRYAEPADATPEALARDVEQLLDMQDATEFADAMAAFQQLFGSGIRSEVMHQLGATTDTPLAWPSPARAWWTVAVLTFTYIISFVDRTILGLLIEPIKVELSLNDTQIGLVQGMAFGLFYAAMGLPLGWLADRTSRRGLIAVGAALWCAATAACGLASSFVQLFLARIAVGVGEAALSPAAMSIISDSFPKERRAVPIGVYAAAAALGAGLALIVGGTVIQLRSRIRWQAAFMFVGLGGLVLLPLLATVVEPARRNESALAVGPTRIDHFIREHADFMVRHYVAVSLYSVVIYAVLSWVPALFIRVMAGRPARPGCAMASCCCCSAAPAPCSAASRPHSSASETCAQPAICVTVLGMAVAGRSSHSAAGPPMDGPRWHGMRPRSCS